MIRIRRIIYKILDILKVLIWFPHMMFRTIIVVVIIYQLNKLSININNIWLGIMGLSYAMYPLIDFLLELHEQEELRELTKTQVKHFKNNK